MQNKFPFIFLAIIFPAFCFGQTDSVKSCRSFYIEPELLGGMVIPDYSPYPSSGPKETVVLNIGSSNIDDKPWGGYFNHPEVGISLTFSQLGNQSVFGDEIDLIPYITFNTTRRLKNTWFIKIGMGASYFTKHYDTITNEQDFSIGSSITWAFKLFAYRSLWTTKKFNLRIGGGYCHSSDGHTQIPNLGLNSVLLGISAQFKQNAVDPDYLYPERSAEQIPDNYFLQLRTGIGMHARGSAFKPTDGAKYGVFSGAVYGGVIFKKYLKLRAGFTYRDYGTLMDYPGLPRYTTWQSSNIIFSVGCEFLVGHVGMDIEAGVNLYKPFYYAFYQRYEEPSSNTLYFLKSTFPQRLGLNYYFINPAKNTRCNIFLAADIDANYGQADFSELSLGYSIRL